MGGDLIFFTKNQELPEKYQFKLTFSDKTGFTIFFWWFGYIHLVKEEKLSQHKMTSRLGISPLDRQFTLENFTKTLTNRKGRIKNFLIDQKNIAGIGNVYIQDILFKAKLHPNRKIPTINEKEIRELYNAIKKTLNQSIRLGGLAYEKDFYGTRGRFTGAKFLAFFAASGVSAFVRTPNFLT